MQAQNGQNSRYLKTLQGTWDGSINAHRFHVFCIDAFFFTSENCTQILHSQRADKADRHMNLE